MMAAVPDPDKYNAEKSAEKSIRTTKQSSKTTCHCVTFLEVETVMHLLMYLPKMKGKMERKL